MRGRETWDPNEVLGCRFDELFQGSVQRYGLEVYHSLSSWVNAEKPRMFIETTGFQLSSQDASLDARSVWVCDTCAGSRRGREEPRCRNTV